MAPGRAHDNTTESALLLYPAVTATQNTVTNSSEPNVPGFCCTSTLLIVDTDRIEKTAVSLRSWPTSFALPHKRLFTTHALLASR